MRFKVSYGKSRWINKNCALGQSPSEVQAKLIDVSFLNNPGIYVIKCKDKYYIGEASNLFYRLGRHTNSLEKNRSDCKELQTDFNKHGLDSTIFSVIEYGSAFIDARKRKNTETRIINDYRKHFGRDKVYNQPKNTNWTNYRCPVEVKGIRYSSMREAAKTLNISRTNLKRKCEDPTQTDYIYCERVVEITSYSHKRTQPCSLYGRTYNSLTEAARDLHMHFNTVKKRCLSKDFPDCFFIEKRFASQVKTT